MNIMFRVDASRIIGTGHIMRCLTLANELKKQGENTIFCSRHLTENLENMIVSLGHQLIKLIDKDKVEINHQVDQYSSWLETSQDFDANEVIAKVKLENIDWVVVDHYALDTCWHKKIKENYKDIKILAINDLFEKSHSCNLFLNQNVVLNEDSAYKTLLDTTVSKLLGPKYSLLRDEFNQYREQAEIRKNGVKNILVFFGGIDIDNVTGKALSALAQIENDTFSVKVVIGAAHPKADEIKQMCVTYGYNLNIQIDNMAELMAWADLSIGASGSASWERSCLGLPSIIITLADNQVAIAKAAESVGLIKYLGKNEEVDQLSIKSAVIELCNNSDELNRMSETCFEYTDGFGKKRVIEKMRALS
jgi:UDP-2,4-diacetamido-2,4,6-trideoxy-beta-L-altropyranose hydrolase